MWTGAIKPYLATLTVTNAMNKSVQFFDTQFQKQVREGDFSLNPFERLALPYLNGRVLDLGCGLGNLAIEAARKGCSVLALDASPAGIEHIRSVAKSESLPITAEIAELADYRIREDFDVIVCIGLLMFMKRQDALRVLHEIKSHVCPGGCAIVNVLIEGTTFMSMFDPHEHYLFGPAELQGSFGGWEIAESRVDEFEAPGDTVKRFSTIVARRTVGKPN